VEVIKRYNQYEELKASNLTPQNKHANKQTNSALFETAACKIKSHNSPGTKVVLIIEKNCCSYTQTDRILQCMSVNRPCGRAVLMEVTCKI